jgi:molybdopterin-guanine dinucleotide biosynthesis protein A
MSSKPVGITGIVLCGGESSRMGSDKAFLQYHKTEQYRHIAKIFSDMNIPVMISCNEQQVKKIQKEYVTLTDDDAFKNQGPISGLLTAFKNNPNDSFILIGCDYPLVNQHHIEKLVSLSQHGYDAICYVRKSNLTINEPLITFYNNSFKEKLFTSFNAGNTSIKKILDQVNAFKIIVEDDLFLKSFDTPEDFHSFHK